MPDDPPAHDAHSSMVDAHKAGEAPCRFERHGAQ